MLAECVAARAGGRGLVGIAHADQVRGEATAEAGAARDDIPPEVRAGGIPMQENDRIAGADIDIGHLPAENVDELLCLSGHCESLSRSSRERLPAPRIG